jgi:DNA repair exonuclease SbcCD nuclease subunit
MHVPDIGDYENSGILVIGDTHFRSKHIEEAKLFIQRVIEIAIEKSPSAIVCLGDILDTHETAKVQPFNIACRFIEDLSGIAPTYVLMGNHDLMNQSQFCSDNHFFNPLKKWENVTIVDTPMKVQIDDINIILCPYVPPGRFMEALSLIDSNVLLFDILSDVEYIFAHQEFKGADMGHGILSSKGDEWNEEYPQIFSGHIHKPHEIGNIVYVGSAMQISSDEDPDKSVVFISDSEYERIPLNLKGLKVITLNLNEMGSIDETLLEKYYLKLKIRGEQQQIINYKNSPSYKYLVAKGIRFAFEIVPYASSEQMQDMLAQTSNKPLTFRAALKDLVISSENEKVVNAYKEVYGEDPYEGAEDAEDAADDEEDEEYADDEEGVEEEEFEQE